MSYAARLRALLVISVLFALAVPAIADARDITWSGQTWTVRQSNGLEGPGPNTFSNSTKNVWVDSKNKLHMRVHKDTATGRWSSAEIFTWQWWGPGKYTWVVESPGSKLDPNVTVGMYVYQDTSHEIDVELAKWGNATDPNLLQYTVHPWQNPGNSVRYPAPAGTQTYSFDWKDTSVAFSGAMTGWLQTWLYAGVDITGGWASPAHINLWQYEGRPPASGRDVEVVFRSFSYKPSA
jgi:hypothetical protein